MTLFGEYIQENENGAGPIINSVGAVYNSNVTISVE
jgi:hypothetical protein